MKPEEYGLTQEEVTKLANTPEVTLSYNLGELREGQKAEFTLLEPKPRQIEYEDKVTGEKRNNLVINAKDRLNGTTVTLWLNSKSLKQQMWKASEDNNKTLKNLDVVISTRHYNHPQYGRVKAYTVTKANFQE